MAFREQVQMYGPADERTVRSQTGQASELLKMEE